LGIKRGHLGRQRPRFQLAESLKQLEALIRKAPDPEGDRGPLLKLRDDGMAGRRFAERLQSDGWSRYALGELLPGMALVGRARFSYRLGARLTNPLARAGIESWTALARLSPAGLSAVSGIGEESAQEILRAASSEWAATYLRTVDGGSAGGSIARQGDVAEHALDLIGCAPDPIAASTLLARLRDAKGSDTQGLAKRMHEDAALRDLSLRRLMPGVGLVESPGFSVKFSVRAANCLARAESSKLSALAGLTPAEILALPEIGVKTAEEILAVAISEWAASYLSSVDDSQAAMPGKDEGGSPNSIADLAGAFAEVEKPSDFEVFRRRRLDPERPSQSKLALELGVTGSRVSQRERSIQAMLSKRLRDNGWPISKAVKEMQGRLGSVALLNNLRDVLTFLDADGIVFSDALPHRQALLLHLGGYRISGEWVLAPDIESLTTAALDRLTEDGPAELEPVDAHLARLGVRKVLRLPWVISQPGFRVVDDRLVKASDG
jgi:hypothetical protein